MVFGVILAGGFGSRMGNVEKPKQYLNLGGKPVIIHTVEKFFVNKNFDEVIILCPPSWIGHTKNLVKKYLNNDKKIVVIEGGETRNETIMASVTYIEKKYGVTDDTIIVTHDAVRPFVTHRILEENIQAAREYGACDTVVSAADTIVQRTEEGHMIADIPDRRRMCQGQTPQSFQAAKIRKLYNSLSEEERRTLPDACRICVLKGEPVYLVEGEVFNTKITYPFDLQVMETMIKGDL